MTLFQGWGGRRAANARIAGDRARDDGRWQQAAALYRLWLIETPGDAAIWVQLGHMLGQTEDFAGARLAYAAAAGLGLNDADFALCRGHLERRAGAIPEARAFYRHSLELDGNHAAAEMLAALPEPEPEPEPELEPLEAPPAADPEAPAEVEATEYPAVPDPDPEPEAAVEIGLEPEAPPEDTPIPDLPPDAPEPEPVASPEPDTARIGRYEGWFGREVSGYVCAPPASLPVVEFRVDGQVIGRARARLPREAPDESGFRAVLDIEGEHAVVSAHLLPGGEELDNSPVLLHPQPNLAGGHAIPAWEVRAATAKPFVMPDHGEVALFVAHAAMGRLKPHVLPYMAALAEAGMAVLLVVVADRPVSFVPGELEAAAGVIVRENVGYDFAAWSHAFKRIPELHGARLLLLLNDSVFGPVDGPRFAAMMTRLRASPADLIGLTESHEYGWHLQSYFLACRPRLLGSWAFHDFIESVRLLGTKDEVIRAYEVPFTAQMKAAGLTIETLFPTHLAINPSLFAWRELIAAGFPFAKLLLLRGLFPEADAHDWRATLAQAGFNLALIDATIAAIEERGPEGADRGLLAQSLTLGAADRPLKIAFFGPWNYDNGLGRASRELLAALRRTGCRINKYPIAKPFHVHRPITPAVERCDFSGPADVAIVHLNSDSWHLLTDAQRGLVAAAGRRIGYWVWEMETLPPAWNADLLSVDRIWAPSRFCAEVFARSVDLPVDVVPHAVPVPPVQRHDRVATLREAGIDPARRVILYVFDGSSYLVRKNPHALVRAFDAAGLAARGWTLLLKTKHLYDRHDAGAGLAALAGEADDVVLLDRALDDAALAALVDAVDLYASPHCAEGFGLTVAEAMAAGKPVVATDYSGTRDLLDADTGYPVRAHDWTLDHDHGHYLAGYRWARIDEPALVSALLKAVDAVETGDTRRAEAGHARVAACLSYDAVARAITASLAALAAGHARMPPAPVIPVDPRYAPDFRDLPAENGIVPVPLDEDGALSAALPEHGEWLVFAPGGAAVDVALPEHLQAAAAQRPDAGVFYADDAAAAAPAIERLRLKPEFDATLLAAQDYIGAPVMVRRAVLESLGGVQSEAGTAVMDDLLLRAAAAGVSIARIPRVLLAHRGVRVAANTEDRRGVLHALPTMRGFDIEDGRAPGLLSLARRFGDDAPRVTLVVPTCRTPLVDGGGSYVERLLEALVRTDWPLDRLTVIVGDDVADVPDWASRDWPFALQRIETPRAAGERFNFAAKMNRLWRLAQDEQIVLLNDDVLPTDSGWLKALQTFAVDPSVGLVGPRLRYEDGRLQHAGIVPHRRVVVHAWLGWTPDRSTPFDWGLAQREWSMLTGAVLATRRSLLDRIGGFDERFSLEFNDIDLCLRVRVLGLRVVFNPAAELVHAEKASRGETPIPGEELALFLSRWSRWLEQDPSFHPDLRRDRLDLVPHDYPGAWYR